MKNKKVQIKFKPVFFDNEDFDDESLEYKFKYKKHPAIEIYLDILEQIKDLDDFNNFKFKADKIFETKEKFDEVNPLPPKEVEIEVMFLNPDEDLIDMWAAPDNITGFHALSSGVFEIFDDDILSKKHRVAVLFDPEKLEIAFKKHRLLQRDVNDNKYDMDFYHGYFNTITHELAHCKEFIENTNGLTPSEVMNLCEEEMVDLTLDDICNGNGILFDYKENVEKYDLNELMEERVEEKGMIWLSKIEIDNKKIEKLTKTILKLDNYKKINKKRLNRF